VIPSENYNNGDYKDILEHELTHIRQRHTFDLLLCELFRAMQWFNPFVWLIKRSVVLNHEYLADRVSIRNNNIKEYQYRLLSFSIGFKNISLAHSFNSLLKSRIIMINKKPTHKYALLKGLVILPVVAAVAYAFASPEYHYVTTSTKNSAIDIYKTAPIVQMEVKGIVRKGNGDPIPGVMVTCTGVIGEATGTQTDADGKFLLSGIKEDAMLLFYCKGYKGQSVKPVFGSEMVVKLQADPNYKPEPSTAGTTVINQAASSRPNPIVLIDGVVTNKSVFDARNDLGYNMGIGKYISGKEATDKYGEKGANGVYEIITRKKAIEMKLNPPFPRRTLDDYPTFQGQRFASFNDWVASHAKYPEEAKAKNIEGSVEVSFKVELDGTLSNITSTKEADRLLVDEVIRAVQSAPKWDSPKNSLVEEPFSSRVMIKFKLPDQVLRDSPSEVFIVVQEMPVYPGGDGEMMSFIRRNIKYPEEAVKQNIQGRVVLRFVVTAEGKTDQIQVLKGVHPLLDAEPKRVISLLPVWKPGMQAGIPVNVWYSVPVTFDLVARQLNMTQISMADLLRFINSNIVYPQQAKESADTGRIFVVMKFTKGGVTKECMAYTDTKEISVPVIQDVVIIGLKPDVIKNPATANSDHSALKTECLRVANLFTVKEIPDWIDKDIEFAIPFKFDLK
jgi:TonB family protein